LSIPTYAIQLPRSPIPAGVGEEYIQKYARAISNVWVAAQWVTPQQAHEWLSIHNNQNRPLSSSWRKLRDKIAAGLWQFNGEAVVFSSDGALLNGQHRLTAIARGEQAVFVLVVYGVDPSAFTSFDQGKTRGRADVLAIAKYENCTTLASALNWMMRYDARAMESSWQPPHNEELLKHVESYPELLDSLQLVKGQWRSYKFVSPGLLTALHAIISQEDAPAAALFFERVVDGIGNDKESWEYMLNRRLMSDLHGHSDIASQVEKAALFFKTWKAIRDNKTPGRVLAWRRAGGEPFPYLWEPDQETI
jgi:hypothetical protein